MAGKPGRGGQNRLSLAVHLARNTFQPSRHGHLVDQIARATSASPPLVSPAQKWAALRGLTGGARRVAAGLLGEFGDWDSASIEVLRSYAASCDRLAVLSAPGGDLKALHRETRVNLQLLKALDLEPR